MHFSSRHGGGGHYTKTELGHFILNREWRWLKDYIFFGIIMDHVPSLICKGTTSMPGYILMRRRNITAAWPRSMAKQHGSKNDWAEGELLGCLSLDYIRHAFYRCVRWTIECFVQWLCSVLWHGRNQSIQPFNSWVQGVNTGFQKWKENRSCKSLCV